MADPRHTRAYRKLQQRMRRQACARLDKCWICGKPIDYAAPAHHPDAWELDHEKPVQQRPDLALDPTNCRSSHCHCNRSRGDGQADLQLGNRVKRL